MGSLAIHKARVVLKDLIKISKICSTGYFWMQDNKSDRWSEGLRFIQFMKNRAHHSGIKSTPYEARFGCKPKVDLTTSFLPEDVLKVINTEEQLEKVIESVQIMDKEQTIKIMQEKEPVSKNVEDIIMDSDKDMLTEDIAVSDICCVCLKETSDALVCNKCREKIHTFCGHASKNNEMVILCTFCYKTENAIKGKINSKINLEIQAKK
ncbi:uncharacterized protein TNCT_127041 [Trichonephila clavata]|uniref:SCAN domain-containing protein n=1 Tax=Trichonephila clavata TaxID=2740835 RepID=A0A8X6KS16_TRICU|nr:uncharacterized protein TNCT_127041 [Trichonephila clavata]